MTKINPWLIGSTAFTLQNPKYIILLPVLSVFLLAYNTAYDFTLRPLNGQLVSYFDDYTLDNGLDLHSIAPETYPRLAEVSGPLITRFSLADPKYDNTLKYDFMSELWLLQQDLESQNQVVLSPLALWPVTFNSLFSEEDKKKIERYVLKNLNHDIRGDVLKLFLDLLGKRNHLVNKAGVLKLYAISPTGSVPVVPKSEKYTLVEAIEDSSPNAVADFVRYYHSITGENFAVNIASSLVCLLQTFALVLILVHAYLSISNQHKIRSIVGLIIGWLTSVSVSAFAAFFFVGLWKGLNWYSLGPINSLAIGSYFVSILLFSSRNMFRTINDLAGDNAFGAPENLHKRLIKFYLGINNSVQNSRGVFKLTRWLRRIFFVDKFATWICPIPNTTVVLLINVGTFEASLTVLTKLLALILPESFMHQLASQISVFQITSLIALVIDHILQLTFLVGIIIIDLNRVDLTDLLKQQPHNLDEDDDESTIHEVNLISSFLLGLQSKKQPLPGSWRHRLGTYCLKTTPVSLRQFLGLWIPSLSIGIIIGCALLIMLIIPTDSDSRLVEIISLYGTVSCTQSYDYLYVLELLSLLVFVFAIAELTFTLTYSKRQRKGFGLDSVSALISPTTSLTSGELAKNDKTKFFECLTLRGTHKSDILKLVSNPKCSFLVSADLDHKILIWSPLSKVESSTPQDIGTFFETPDPSARKAEFWPVNHVEVSDDGNYVVLINNKHCRIKCFDRKTLSYLWEVSLTSELNQSRKKMHVVNAFFRKKTVAGFLARKLLQKRKQTRRNDSVSSIGATPVTGNFPPPAPGMEQSESKKLEKSYDKDLVQEEFVLVLETGEMITISCQDVQIKVYNLLTQLYEGQPELRNLKIISLKFLKTPRMNERVVCNLSNDEIIIGTTVNNIWRFQKLVLDSYYSSTKPVTNFAPPLMSRSGSTISYKHDFSTAFELQRQTHMQRQEIDSTVFSDLKKYQVINKSTVITIDFVGMIVRVKDLLAELIDVLTGTVLKVFGIGHFKPDTFRVIHSEPTHCKFCGCASFESLSLVYEDFYDKTLIMHTFTVENKKSRNNICLRVERDPREIRCVGLDSTIEKQYWYEDIDKWEVTDMNVILGIRKITTVDSESDLDGKSETGFSLLGKNHSSSLRTRKKHTKTKAKPRTIQQLWQGFVITAQNGKLLEYNIPDDAAADTNYASTRPNFIVKYGFKSVAIAFGSDIKILYLGSDKLIENDLYYSGTTSINSILKPTAEGAGRNELLFINKRRRMLEKRNAKMARSGAELPDNSP